MLRIWSPGAAFTDSPAVVYSAEDGVVERTFTDNSTIIPIGPYNITVQYKDRLNAVFIRGSNTGTMFAVGGFK